MSAPTSSFSAAVGRTRRSNNAWNRGSLSAFTHDAAIPTAVPITTVLPPDVPANLRAGLPTSCPPLSIRSPSVPVPRVGSSNPEAARRSGAEPAQADLPQIRCRLIPQLTTARRRAARGQSPLASDGVNGIDARAHHVGVNGDTEVGACPPAHAPRLCRRCTDQTDPWAGRLGRPQACGVC
jgi:hypothetical protein